MTPPRIPTPQVVALFDEALDLDAVARLAFVARIAADNPDTAHALAALLAADARAEAFLEQPAIARFEGLIEHETERDSSADDISDVSAGALRLLRAIGRGGMGMVYLAERVEADFRQLAAVKLLRDGFGSEERRRRFVRERQILAGLQHDGIARMLDGGIASDGRPYFAMEFVEGEVLTSACDALRMGIDARIGHFLGVCDAVAYLHRNLVVHRDLKPPNIMLAKGAAGARTKLLDFGIAKLLADEDGETAQTRAEFRMFTPEYAAPEQLRGETITTATDVYALGLLLHELLTGTRARSAPEAERSDSMWMPPRPSIACTRGDDAASRAEARGLSVGKLRKRLAGDLDRIVQHALEPDPFARYPSVDALATDLRRHLAKLPVLARGAGVGYVAARFVRRHRIAVAASVAVVAALIMGLAIAMQQRSLATLEARKAEEVRDFVLGLFRFADPDIAKGENFRVRELLARGAKRVIDELDGQTEVQLDLANVIASAQMQLGAYTDAVVLWDRLVAWSEALHGHDSEPVAAMLIRRAEALQILNRFDVAAADLTRALAIRVSAEGQASIGVGRVKRELALAYGHMRDVDTALPYAQDALAIARGVDPPNREDVVKALNALGLVLTSANRHKEAEPVHREAFALAKDVYGEDSAAALATGFQLGQSLFLCGQQDDSFALMSDILERRRRVLPKEHPDLALSLNAVAGMESDRGHLDIAEGQLQEALAIGTAAFGPDNEATINTRNSLAIVKYRRGDLEGSATETEAVIAAFARVLGPDHPNVATTKANLAVVLHKLHRDDEAERLHREALAAMIAHSSGDTADIVSQQRTLGTFLLDCSKFADAQAELEAAAVRSAEVFGDTNAMTLDLLGFIGDAQFGRGDCASVTQSQTELLHRCDGIDPVPVDRIARIHLRLGRAALAAGRLDEAEHEFVAAHEVLAARGGRTTFDFDAELRLAQVDVARDRTKEARERLDALLVAMPVKPTLAKLRAEVESTLESLPP